MVRMVRWLLVALVIFTPSGGPAMGTQTPTPVDPMGGMGLGGSAQVVLLADGRLESLAAGPLAWVAYEAVPGNSPGPHRHPPAFIYAVDGSLTLTLERRTTALRPGQAAYVGQNASHTHGGQGRFWEIRLTAPGGPPPTDLSAPKPVFATGSLQGISRPPVLALFVRVDLAPGGETSVHTHPGPEFIVVTTGEITYQNALIGTQRMRVGQWHAIPPDTAVQKRNPGNEPASFLSLFLLDPNRPFTAPGQF